MSKIKLNNVDLAWFRMDNPANPMMITVVIKLDGQINYDRFIETIDMTLGRYRRFKQRIIRPRGFFQRPYWEDVPGYRVEDHVERVTLQPPADEISLQELVSQKMNTVLDRAQPLWKMTLVDNYSEGSAIIARVHHVIADGISLMQVFMQMAKKSPDEPANQVQVNDPKRDERQADPPIPPATMPAIEDGQMSLDSIAKSSKPSPSPFKPISAGMKTSAHIAAAIARIIFRPPDPPTLLKGPLEKNKKAVWSMPYSMPEFRKIAQQNNATPNDVFIAIASGAIRQYITLRHDNRVRNIRGFVMVNLRRRFFDLELGNKFGLIFLTLPIKHDQLQERLHVVKNGMDRLKESSEYDATYRILNILGMLPEWVEYLATKILDTKGSIVITNVPGSRQQLYLAGSPINSIIGWAPESGRIGVGVSFLSYNERAWIGVSADTGEVPDPEKIIELFDEEFKAYQAVYTAGISG
jgi:diacylglycerol O-acyltransferase